MSFNFFNFSTDISVPVILIFVTWTLVWKGMALWRAGRNNQIVWFVVMLLLNTAGVLPIIYLLFFQKKGSWIGIDGKKGKKKNRKN